MRVTATVLKRRARVLPVLCLAIGLSGCFWARGSGEARGMIGWKTVMRKMDPVYLIAVDGSQCGRKVQEGKGGRALLLRLERRRRRDATGGATLSGRGRRYSPRPGAAARAAAITTSPTGTLNDVQEHSTALQLRARGDRR